MVKRTPFDYFLQYRYQNKSCFMTICCWSTSITNYYLFYYVLVICSFPSEQWSVKLTLPLMGSCLHSSELIGTTCFIFSFSWLLFCSFPIVWSGRGFCHGWLSSCGCQRGCPVNQAALTEALCAFADSVTNSNNSCNCNRCDNGASSQEDNKAC